jgi:CoA:oxalate CoA-transferase
MLPFLIDNNKVDIFKAGQESGLGFSFVATMKDILEMEQLLDRDYFVQLDHPVAGTLTYPGAPITPEDSVEAWVFRRAPLLGEHTASALNSWLGYSEAQVLELVQKGVIAQSEGT